jgi:hypothetical protein
LRIEALSDIASGFHFSDDGSLVAVNEERRSELRNQLKNSAQDLGLNTRFIRWFFSTARDRTIFPASGVKVSDWVNNSLLTNPNLTKEWMLNALAFLPNNSLLHIGLAGFESDSRRADFLRSFGLARLPDSGAFCTRAAELLLEQRRPELALSAVEKALRADPTDLPAQRLRLKVLDAMPR